MRQSFLQKAPAVEAALRERRPIVALESTVIAQGLPRPLNLEVANRLEEIVTDGGVLPATIAVINGHLKVGLGPEELRFIAQEQEVSKISMRDLPVAVARGLTGATTVAATIWAAHRAGLRVMATGGIGGVHRGDLADVSADLPELARTPLVVVCSGAKIVLDLPATREWLETHGIPVIGYQCNEFPGFYSRTSNLKVDARVESPAEVVEIFRAQRSLGIDTALLVTVPVPDEAEVPASSLAETLDRALNDAESSGITGRELTPYLLSRMAEESQGATLRANIALLQKNARLAAEIATALPSEF